MATIHIDAGASRRGQLVPADRQLAGAAGSLFQRAQQIARTVINERADAQSAQFMLDRFDSAVDRVTAKVLSRGSSRYDSIGDSGGGLLAGQLRHVTNLVLEEKHPVPSAMRLFPVDGTVPLGARTVAVRRLYEAGEARVHRGGDASNIPRVSLAQAEMDFQVRHYVTSAVWDVFEEMSSDYAQTNGVSFDYVAQLTRIARDVLERFTNEMTWYGDSAFKIFGVLNYPWLDKEVSDLTSWGGTPSDTTVYLRALNGYVNRQHHASKGVMGPNKMVTSPRLADWIEQTPYQSASGLRDRFLGEMFRASSRIEGEIERAFELEDVLGANVDAMLFYRDDAMGIQNILPGGGIRSLPLHQTDIERRQIFFMPHAGVRMLEVGNNLLVYVDWNG